MLGPLLSQLYRGLGAALSLFSSAFGQLWLFEGGVEKRLCVPDLLAHYVVSYLVAPRVVGYRWAVPVAFIGLASALDTLAGFHGWVTHSVVLSTGVTLLAALLLVWRLNGRGLSYLALASSLYTLYILMDMLTDPTQILWPVGGVSYAFNVKVDGLIQQGGAQLEPSIAVIVEPVDFARGESL